MPIKKGDTWCDIDTLEQVTILMVDIKYVYYKLNGKLEYKVKSDFKREFILKGK
jgi:hypothetical protein